MFVVVKRQAWGLGGVMMGCVKRRRLETMWSYSAARQAGGCDLHVKSLILPGAVFIPLGRERGKAWYKRMKRESVKEEKRGREGESSRKRRESVREREKRRQGEENMTSLSY